MLRLKKSFYDAHQSPFTFWKFLTEKTRKFKSSKQRLICEFLLVMMSYLFFCRLLHFEWDTMLTLFTMQICWFNWCCLLEMLFQHQIFCSRIFGGLGWVKHYCRSDISVGAGAYEKVHNSWVNCYVCLWWLGYDEVTVEMLSLSWEAINDKWFDSWRMIWWVSQSQMIRIRENSFNQKW